MPVQTERYARQVLGGNRDPRLRNFWPGRVRGAYLDLALALAKMGRADEAGQLGIQALADCAQAIGAASAALNSSGIRAIALAGTTIASA